MSTKKTTKTTTTTTMASEYHSSSLSNNTNNRFNSYKSNAFCAPRMGSLRLKAREPPPSVHVPTTTPSATNKVRINQTNNNFRDSTEQKLNTINLLKSIKSSQLAVAATKSTYCASAAAPATSTKPSSTVNAFSLGSNKSYYSSTRSFSSKIVDKSKLVAMSVVDKSCAQLSTSSGASSIESIVPKYNGFVSGSKKRIYSSVRVTKKEMPSYINGGTVTINSTQTAAKYASTVKFTANKKQMKENNNNNCRTIETLTSNLSSSSTTSTSSYSTKFPNGLPFENEFYHKRRNSTSTKSEVSDYGSYENDDDHDDNNDVDRHSLLPFENEFERQRPSSNDEALYVDFSKPIATNRKNTDDDHDIVHKQINNNRQFGSCNAQTNNTNNINNNNKYETTSSSNRNYVCNPNEVIIRDQPVVYVAVQWWAPTNNNCDHTNTTHHQRRYDCNMVEPIQSNLV